jgi:serine/threonine-protein kinase
MGVVYLATDTKLERPVALKIISPDYASLPQSVERLQQEAKAAARLIHPHIVAVYALGEAAGKHYIAMELLEGVDLAERLAHGGPLPLTTALRYTRQSSEALAYAAERQIIHRDIKPSNLFITTKDEAKVMDFGLAKCLDSDTSLTVSGSLIGTPSYMSPEQGAGGDLDYRSDMYSLGCTLFTMLTCKKPFEGRSPLEVLMQHNYKPLPIPPLWRSRYGSEFITFLEKMTAKKPEDRYGTWKEVLAALAVLEVKAKALEANPVSSAPRSEKRWMVPAIVGTVAVVGIGAGVAAMMMGPAEPSYSYAPSKSPSKTPAAPATPVPTPAVATPVPPTATPAAQMNEQLPAQPAGEGQELIRESTGSPRAAVASAIDERIAMNRQYLLAAREKAEAAQLGEVSADLVKFPPGLRMVFGQEMGRLRRGFEVALTVQKNYLNAEDSVEAQVRAARALFANPPANRLGSATPEKFQGGVLIYLTAINSPSANEIIQSTQFIPAVDQQDILDSLRNFHTLDPLTAPLPQHHPPPPHPEGRQPPPRPRRQQ